MLLVFHNFSLSFLSPSLLNLANILLSLPPRSAVTEKPERVKCTCYILQQEDYYKTEKEMNYYVRIQSPPTVTVYGVSQTCPTVLSYFHYYTLVISISALTCNH